MTVKWYKKKDKKTRDITNAVATIEWSGSVEQAARTADISVVNGLNDDNVKALKLNIATGDVIKLYENGKLIFYGEVQRKEKGTGSETLTYNCTDLLGHLLRSKAVYNFKNKTAEEITKKVCADFKVPVGTIAKTGVRLKKLICDETEIYNIIMRGYTKAAKNTGKKYMVRMDGTKLSVVVKGTVVKGYTLSDSENITESSYEESIENMVNAVIIYDDKGKKVGTVKNDTWIGKYGRYQETYKKEKGVDSKKAAKALLQGVEKTVSMDGINGNIQCVAGNGLKVKDTATGLTGIFWIDNDTHIWENGNHKMSLDLNFKNIMDSQEDD